MHLEYDLFQFCLFQCRWSFFSFLESDCDVRVHFGILSFYYLVFLFFLSTCSRDEIIPLIELINHKTMLFIISCMMYRYTMSRNTGVFSKSTWLRTKWTRWINNMKSPSSVTNYDQISHSADKAPLPLRRRKHSWVRQECL